MFDLIPDRPTLCPFLAYTVEHLTDNEQCRSCSVERTHLLIKEVLDTFDCSIANQTCQDFEENRKNKHYCHYVTVNQATLKLTHYSGLFSITSGRTFTLFSCISSPISFGRKSNILSHKEMSQSVFHPSLQSFKIKSK